MFHITEPRLVAGIALFAAAYALHLLGGIRDDLRAIRETLSVVSGNVMDIRDRR